MDRFYICQAFIDVETWLYALAYFIPRLLYLVLLVVSPPFHLHRQSLNMLGLLARGLAAIAPRGGLEGWRWILIIEGLLVSCNKLSTLKF